MSYWHDSNVLVVLYVSLCVRIMFSNIFYWDTLIRWNSHGPTNLEMGAHQTGNGNHIFSETHLNSPMGKACQKDNFKECITQISRQLVQRSMHLRNCINRIYKVYKSPLQFQTKQSTIKNYSSHELQQEVTDFTQILNSAR